MTRYAGAHCRGWVLRAALASFVLAGADAALAQRNIGAAVTVAHDVAGILSGRTRPVTSGVEVYANETIRTADASTAQLRFLDESSLSVGPTASVVLDRFVFNPDRTAREAAFQVTAGAARWVAGASTSRAYRIRTPHAIIGVRGTAFDLLVEPYRTVLTLREGEVRVCPIQAPRQCVTLSNPGTTVAATPTEIQGPVPAGPSSAQFAAICLTPVTGAAGLCTKRAFATSLAALEGRCPEGRTASGSCMNAALASAARQRAIVETQSKISYSTRLVLPGQERHLPRPINQFEFSLFGLFDTSP